MGRFHGVLLVSDFDDTLVNRQKQIPPRTMEALQRYTAEGGRFTLASGRSVVSIRQQLCGLPINAPVITSNGTQIYDYAEEMLLSETPLPETAPADFAKVMAAFPQVAVEIYSHGKLYCVRPNQVTAEHLRITGQTALERSLEQIPDGWVYAKFEEENLYLQELQQYLHREFHGRYEAIFSNPYLLEIEAGGCSKGAGVLKLAELLGIAREHIYCAGDQENDVSMLKIASVSFTPAGSSQAAIDAANVVVCDCDQGAIADVIEYLEKRYVVS